LSISGTNGVFATLVSGPTPASATVGTLGTAFTWTYRVTAEEANGTLTFGGNAHSDGVAIFPYAVSNSTNINTVLFVNDITGPNLINDANLPTSGPEVFTIGARITNSGLSTLTNTVVNLGNGTTPGVFPTTTMTLSQTNNTYQGTFSLNPLGGISDCTRPLGTLGAAKAMIAGRIDFNGDGVITTTDDGTLSNGQIVIDGLIDVDRNGTVNGSDDYNRPPGLFVGYRDPAIINGFVDSNNDGVISALDNSNYGGETKVVYWQVQYKVEDAFGKPTYGNGTDFNDDLRYRWFIWATANDGLITRTDVVKDFAKVRQMQSAAANKATPSGAYLSSSAKVVIDGQVDINGDGAITSTDDGTYYGYNVINGLIDITGDGNITINDDGVVNTFTVINGYVDADPNNIININDDGILVAVGNTFTVTFNKATFGTVGEGFDENRDGLSDYDFWFQPIGEPNFPTAFRLVNIVAQITGSGGSNPLNGITNTYVNDPYISRLIGNMSSTFDATYTYTFQVLANANGCLTPYQEAASGTNNVKYNGDYPSCIPVKTYGGNFVLPATGLAANANLNGAHATIDWVTVTELNTSFFEVERSLNGIDFSKIAYVKASGNSTVQHDYTSFDNIAAYTNYPKIFYRIKLISENGSVQYSNITAVTPVNNARVKVWPNPFTDKIILSAKITTSEKVSVRLYDAGGRLTCSKDVYVRPGNQELILNDIKHLQSGIYHLRVAGVSFVETFILRKE
ncbi:MAG TPA: T9SS type A sorting domain-containing protein, partial [Lacibacter sp.]|nr:T9SS type A sorting domain-containing protein [Lacibacter sp.]